MDVIVIGAGHAGCEAALAAARMGLRTAVVTLRPDRIGFMPCNPAIGGLGKGHLVRELDALGGEMGRAIDAAGIQFRLLNRSKGPAVWSPRAQADKDLYAAEMRRRLEAQPNLSILVTSVEGLETESLDATRRIRGIRITGGECIDASAVIITTGTFLDARMHCGAEQTAGGRSGEPTSTGLSRAFRELGFRLGRLKTGTPPRLWRDSLDFTRFETQLGDEPPRPFSHATEKLEVAQVPCWITRTTADAHAIVRANLHRAPMYNGQIRCSGPRYCPSIEDKVVRFAERDSHHLFLEPEGRESTEIYVNGLSTSLPRAVQDEIVRCIPGLETAAIARHGYAVEYDYVPSGQLLDTLETRTVRGLYLAGQINGTSGYEEAAAQGLIAGINAAAACRGLEPLILKRSEAYIGVLVDDLVRMDLVEPYRMFTSRAEFRLSLRIDNAADRLMHHAERFGLLADDARRMQARDARAAADLQRGLATAAPPDARAAIAARTGITASPGTTLEQLLRMPAVRLVDLAPWLLGAPGQRAEVLERVEIQTKYAGYVRRQEREAAELARLEERAIPVGLDFEAVSGLSSEAAQKLSIRRPRTLGQAARIDGVRATDLSLLLVHLERHNRLPEMDISR
jgi:tRNA uridine 5-carboxymethylaminomethyl modification enzyme